MSDGITSTTNLELQLIMVNTINVIKHNMRYVCVCYTLKEIIHINVYCYAVFLTLYSITAVSYTHLDVYKRQLQPVLVYLNQYTEDNDTPIAFRRHTPTASPP